jgi:hypothetical protein
MKLLSVGNIVKLSGAVSVAVGVILSLHHIPAAVALIGGGVAYFVGSKLGGQ